MQFGERVQLQTVIIAIVVGVLSLSLQDASRAAGAAVPRVRTTESVNMRVAPNLSGAIIDSVPVSTVLRVRCASSGAQIYDTPVWFYVDFGAKRGFVSAYYSTAEYETWADLATRYGIPQCERPAPGVGGSVYYQPRFSEGDPIAPYSTYTATKDWWASPGNCVASAADYWPAFFDGRLITRAAGWSLGRLGVTYLLDSNFERATAIHTIILFDPGDLADYESECDQKYDQDGLMAKWLAQSQSNRLLVLAGKHTRDAGHRDSQGRMHQGIQRYLFPAVREAGRSSQVLICNYDNMAHSAVLANFAGLIASGNVSTCPATSTVQPNSSWHP